MRPRGIQPACRRWRLVSDRKTAPGVGPSGRAHFSRGDATTASLPARSPAARCTSLRGRSLQAAGARPGGGARNARRLRGPLLRASVRLGGTVLSAFRPRVYEGGGPPRGFSGSVAARSAPHPTRLETRTKESNMCASHWTVLNLKAQ